MKRRFGNIAVFTFVCLIAQPAAAQNSPYETPEYSGPAARFDRELEADRNRNNALRASRERLQNIQRDRRNDLAVDRQNVYRTERVQNEMARKREESLRLNLQYMLQTNE